MESKIKIWRNGKNSIARDQKTRRILILMQIKSRRTDKINKKVS